MGNVPISCCRSESPRSHHLSSKNHHNSEKSCGCLDEYEKYQYSKQTSSESHKNSNRRHHHHHHHDYDDQQPASILQHISEREPDDSENDPSSNPFNQPIFVTRSLSTLKTAINGNHDHNNETDQNGTTVIPSISKILSKDFSTSAKSSNSSSTCSKQAFSHLNPAFLNPCHPENKKGPNNHGQNHWNHGNNHSHQTRHWLVKSSSCSTIFTDDSTISQPDLKMTIKCVSLAIYYHIKHRSSDRTSDIFDEVVYPLRMPMNNVNGGNSIDKQKFSHDTDPNQRTIYEFVKTLFNAAQLTSEYAITTLVYVERLMTYAEIDLTPRTWRRMFLGAILLSSKVWEDQAVWNVDYAQILEEISVEDINELERQFLELIQFNMNVPSSVYAKYYFNLRTLAVENGVSKPSSILTLERARDLEVSIDSELIYCLLLLLYIDNLI